jgi:pimeloyl-ACP methyl ester carboxylesterase
MHAQIKDSRLVVIPDAAHLSNIEQTQFFNDSLITFLQPKGNGF